MADILDTKEVYAEEYYFKQKQPKMGNGDMPLFSIEENDSISCYIKIEDEQSIIFQYSKGNCVLQSSNNVAIDRVFFTNTNSRVYFYVHSTKLIDLQYWTLYGTTVQDETVLQYHELANQNIEITGSGVFLAGDVVFNKAAFDLMEVRNTLTASDIINRYRHVDLPETLDPDDPNRNVYIKIPPFIGDYTIYMEDNDNDLMATIKFTRGINFNVEFPFASAVYSTQQLQYIKEIFADKFGNTYIATRAFGELYFSQTNYKEIVVPTTVQGTAPFLPIEEKLFSYVPEQLNRMVIFGNDTTNFGLDVQGEIDAHIIKQPEVSSFPKLIVTEVLEVTGEVIYHVEEAPKNDEYDLVIVDKDTNKLYKLGATIGNDSININKNLKCNILEASTGVSTNSIATDRISNFTSGKNIMVENTAQFESSVGIDNILTATRDDTNGSTLRVEVPTQFDGTVYVDGDLHVASGKVYTTDVLVNGESIEDLVISKQDKLIAGENIVIDEATNTISADTYVVPPLAPTANLYIGPGNTLVTTKPTTTRVIGLTSAPTTFTYTMPSAGQIQVNTNYTFFAKLTGLAVLGNYTFDINWQIGPTIIASIRRTVENTISPTEVLDTPVTNRLTDNISVNAGDTITLSISVTGGTCNIESSALTPVQFIRNGALTLSTTDIIGIGSTGIPTTQANINAELRKAIEILESLPPVRVGDVYCTSTPKTLSNVFPGTTWVLIDKSFWDGGATFTIDNSKCTAYIRTVRTLRSVRVRAEVRTKVAITDTSIDFFQLTASQFLSHLGMSVPDLPFSYIMQTTGADAPRAAILYTFEHTGLLKTLDAVGGTVGAGETFYVDHIWPINPISRMADSACDKFFYKRLT